MAYEYKDIIFEKKDKIAIITLNRPEKMNAYTAAMRASIWHAIEDVADDDNIRLLILTGSGRAFCAGRDLSTDESQNPADIGVGNRHRFAPAGWLALRMYQLAKPTIAAVNGVAAGGGFGLALSCDFRIASENARFGSVFIKRGLNIDTGVAYFLPRYVGITKALEICLTGDLVDAKEAERLGMVSKVVPHDDLMKETVEFANRMANNAPISLQMTKRSIYKGQNLDLPEVLDYETFCQQYCTSSQDFQEGRKAFLEKREPVFKGR